MVHKAFVSSTFKDLKDHRNHVIASLRGAGVSVDPMEDWSAATDEPKLFSQDRIKDCDLCVLLVGFRRGHVPDGETLSITQLEYRTAVESGIDVLVFMLKEESPWPREFDELDKDPEIRRWRGDLMEHKGVGFFGLEPSSIAIAPALTRWIAEKQRPAPSTTVAHQMPVSYWLGRPESLGDGLYGREDELGAIASSFAEGRAVVTSGGAGSGKSRLAAEHAHRAKVDGFWAAAGADLASTLAGLAPALGIDVEGKSDDEIAAEVQRGLAGLSPETLWVIDNLEDLEQVNDLLNGSGSVGLLITTRDSRRHLVPSTVAYHWIEALEPDAAKALLCSRSETSPEDPTVALIANRVGRLPLALEVLAVRLGEPRQSPEGVLEQLDQAPTVLQMQTFEKALGASIPRAEGVFASIRGTLDDLGEQDREALSGLAYVADAPVPERLATALMGVDDEGLTGLLSRCSRQSVLSWREGQVGIHALTVAVLAATNLEGALVTAVARSFGRLSSIWQDDPVAVRAELAHHERIVEEARRGLGSEAVSVLNVSNQLASAYHTAGRYDDAIRIFEETLEVRERVHGPEHPDTLTTRSNRALAYRDAGRTDDAIPMHEEILEVKERVLGPEHRDTLISRNNLAVAYGAAGRTNDALRIFEETLEVTERVLGPEHPDTLGSRNNLAEAYGAAGRTDDALRIFEETLEVMDRVLGPEHPVTLISRNNLAVAYRAAGRTDDAMRIFEETLGVTERVLGPEHPETLNSRNNLAAAYRAAGRTDDAIRIHEETLEARERVLGPEHPNILNSRNSLALAYDAAGRTDDAIRIFEETLEVRERVLGPEHPDTLDSRNDLAAAYRAAGRIDHSVKLESRCKN